MQGLGQLLGSGVEHVDSVSDDGSIVVGYTPPRGAFIWDAAHGMRSLQEALVSDYGFDLTGWTLDGAIIAADGRTILGTGTNPLREDEMWVATITVPSSHIRGDINFDGHIDRLDVARFATHLGKNNDVGWATGDFDGDGATTLLDLFLQQANLGSTLPSPAASVAVPEPANWAMLLFCGLVGGLSRGWRRRSLLRSFLSTPIAWTAASTLPACSTNCLAATSDSIETPATDALARRPRRRLPLRPGFLYFTALIRLPGNVG
jgi:hypothetical protein